MDSGNHGLGSMAYKHVVCERIIEILSLIPVVVLLAEACMLGLSSRPVETSQRALANKIEWKTTWPNLKRLVAVMKYGEKP